MMHFYIFVRFQVINFSVYIYIRNAIIEISTLYHLSVNLMEGSA